MIKATKWIIPYKIEGPVINVENSGLFRENGDKIMSSLYEGP